MDAWVKLSTRFYLDPKVASLPDADTEMAFVRSLAYCGSEQTEGFVPVNIVPTLFRRRRYEASVRALEDACLWSPVTDGTDRPMGWRVNRWEDWQQELDALARRRSADRDRKRRERSKKAQVKPTSRDMSRDRPADVTAQRGRGEKEISYGDLVEGGYVGKRARDSPLPRKCPKHINDPDPPNCGACADTRRAAEQAEREHAEQAEAARLADIVRVRACPHCDADGWAYEPGSRRPATPYVRCTHPEPS